MPANETAGDITPDGRWLAYNSNESGRNEVYVRPFPDVDAGKWQVSTAGGVTPLWARSGRELFYHGADGALMNVAVETSGPTFASGTPAPVLEQSYRRLSTGRNYDVSPAGKRLLMLKEAEAAEGGAPAQLVVGLNWFEELKRLTSGVRPGSP